MVHKEGDTASEDELDSQDEQLESEDEPSERIQTVLSRRIVDGGYLEYLVRFDDGSEDWYNRSDLWDFGQNSAKLTQYDKLRPVDWDIVCEDCGDPFDRSAEGCENCRCPDCEAPCRVLAGVSYGCPRHPVL